MTPPEQEALSRKYSNATAIVLRLSDGGYALFNCQRKLIGITNSLEELALGIATIESTVEATPKRKPGLSLEDLGL